MTRPRLYAAVYRYHAPQGDGSVGVAVFNQPPDWKTRPPRDLRNECRRPQAWPLIL